MGSELSVAEVLERAADLIEPEGAWIQGQYGRGPGAGYSCLCMYGAISEVGGCMYGSPGDKACDVLEDMLDTSVPRWNDQKGRTQAEVVAKLREAAALARADEGVSHEL